MRDTFICGGVHTSIGRYGGVLAGVHADDLTVIPLCELLSRNPGLGPAAIDDVILGCANQAGEDNRNAAHMVTLLAGYPHSVLSTTINHLCGSGLDVIGFATRVIKTGDADLLIVGGMESMSHASFVIGKASMPYQRQSELFDTTIGWCFVNPLAAQHFGAGNMPETAENVAELLNISRANQDALIWRSRQRTEQAQRDDVLAQEIVPAQVTGKKGVVSVVRDDEHPCPETTLGQLAKLRASFRQGGVIAAGNASGVDGGAAALIIASEQQAATQRLAPRARIVAMATTGVEPRLMGLGPVPVVHKVLERVGLNINDMNLIELSEALAAQAPGVFRQFGMPDDAAHVNPNGGAVALDHPLGMSGARLALGASLKLQRRGGRYALCMMYIGIGQGIAIIPE